MYKWLKKFDGNRRDRGDEQSSSGSFTSVSIPTPQNEESPRSVTFDAELHSTASCSSKSDSSSLIPSSGKNTVIFAVLKYTYLFPSCRLASNLN